MLDSGLLPEGRFIRFLGAKTNLVKYLLPLIPEHKIYVEVFGGSAELLLSKPKSWMEVYNDVDGELVNLFEVVRTRPVEFLERSQFLVYSRALQDRWRKEDVSEDPVEWAVRTWYIYQSSFGGRREGGWAFGRQMNQAKSFPRRLARIEELHRRLSTVNVDKLDFVRCVKNWDTSDTFFFMDPPYRNCKQANQIRFSDGQYQALAEICHRMEGKFLLTTNDDAFLMRLFGDFTIARFLCPAAGTGMVRSSKKKKRGHYSNLFIRNYRAPRRKKS